MKLHSKGTKPFVGHAVSIALGGGALIYMQYFIATIAISQPALF